MSKELTFKEALRAIKGMKSKHMLVENLINNYDQTYETICRWLDGHPLKTRKQDFIEKFPNAKILSDGTPNVCCEDLGYCEDEETCKGDCNECWNKAIDEDANNESQID